jgi:hypothetical protein
MSELDGDVLSLAMCEVYSLLQWSYLGVFPESRVFRRNSSFGRDCCGFNTANTWTSLNYSTQMGPMPISVMAVFRTVLT